MSATVGARPWGNSTVRRRRKCPPASLSLCSPISSKSRAPSPRSTGTLETGYQTTLPNPRRPGLRGFGNVVWYPVSSVPVLLGDGARLFDEIGEHKLRLAGGHFRLRLTVEFPHGRAPTVALINGHPAALTVAEASGPDQAQEAAGVATTSLDGAVLGFEAPSLFVAIRTQRTVTNTTVWALPEDEASVQAWTTARSEEHTSELQS